MVSCNLLLERRSRGLINKRREGDGVDKGHEHPGSVHEGLELTLPRTRANERD